MGRAMCHFWKQQADRHLVGKPDQHPQHPPRHDLLQDGERNLGYANNYFVKVFDLKQEETYFNVVVFENIYFYLLLSYIQ